jgi:hypothetical protein
MGYGLVVKETKKKRGGDKDKGEYISGATDPFSPSDGNPLSCFVRMAHATLAANREGAPENRSAV